MANHIKADVIALLAKVESSYGSDPTPTEGVDLRGDLSLTVDIRRIAAARMWHSSSRKAHAHIPHSIGFSFQVAVTGVELVDDGVPGIHPFYIGSGFEVATSGTAVGTDVQAEYTLKSFGHGSYALYVLFFDETSGQVVRLKILGCRGNIEHVVNVNGELLANVSGMGLYAGFEAVATISAPSSYAYGVSPFVCTNMTHTLGGTARKIKAFSVSTNWNVAALEDVNGTATASEIKLERGADNGPGGSIDPVASSTDFANSSSFKTQWVGATAQAHVLSLNDGTRTFAYNAPSAQINAAPAMTRDGSVMRFNTPFLLSASSDAGDDDLVFTHAQA